MSPGLESLKRAVAWERENGKGSVVTKLTELEEMFSAIEENERLRADRELLLQAALWSMSHTVPAGMQFYFSRLRDAVDKVARSPQELTAAKPDVTTD
jgi:hypothetical protein